MTTVNSQKYSKALLEVAEEQSQLEVILSEVNELTQLLKKMILLLSSERKYILQQQNQKLLTVSKKIHHL